jgi:hypothetical protein
MLVSTIVVGTKTPEANWDATPGEQRGLGTSAVSDKGQAFVDNTFAFDLMTTRARSHQSNITGLSPFPQRENFPR